MLRVFAVNKNCNQKFLDTLSSLGEVVLIEKHSELNDFEGFHADMQIFKTGENSAICAPGFDMESARKLRELGVDVIYGKSTLSEKYPENIKYNVLCAGKSLFHNIKYTDESVVNHAKNNGIRLINVNQGYCACTSMFFSFCNLILTADRGIINAAKLQNYNVCIFEHTEEISLDGYKNGFIGGCGVILEGGRKVIFNGEFTKLYPDTASELKAYGIDVADGACGALCDIGGVVSFTY